MKELKASDKVAQKMTHDGAVQENLATGEVTNISSREAETDFSPSEEPAAAAESAAEHIAAAHGRRRAKKAAKAEADTVREGSAAGQRPSSRLQFTEEERADPDLQKYIRRSDRAADRLDAAKEAIPKKKVLKTERVFDEAAGRGKTRFRFEEVEKKPNGHLRHNPLSRPAQKVLLTAHNEVHKVEQENVGVEAGHKGEELAERGLSYVKSKVQAGLRQRRMRPWRDVSRAERASVRANADFLYQKALHEDPALAASNPVSRYLQKKRIQRNYAKQVRQAGKTAKDTTAAAQGAARRIKEAAYAGLEADLQYELDNYESLHPGYDEYRFNLDTIGHDPYVLISILSALHEGVFTVDEVQSELQTLFDRQYTLTETVTVEVRYRTETRTDSDGNEYEVEVPYDYYICTVTLENFDLSHLPVYLMDEEQLSLYAAYMSTLGNRPDLFGTAEYPNASTLKEPTYYDIPPEALEDETFAAMISEAEKYLGYPYVWGGSSPSTSFDCSGFVSWVINHSGWSVGRQTAQGLYNLCTPVSSAQAKPGDLIFFVGTYDTAGVSHVGIYVGGGMMIHCGDPISYANINTSYWQSHYFSFGRLP